MRNLKAFLYGFLIIFGIALGSEAFAAGFSSSSSGPFIYSTPEDAARPIAENYCGASNVGEIWIYQTYDDPEALAAGEVAFVYRMRYVCLPSTRPNYHGSPTIYAQGNPECPSGQEWDVAGQECITPPPVCESPSYIDANSGECVTPEEVCYTDLESMADECILLGAGDPDPADEIPEGCAVDSTGKQICLTEDPNCYTINGIQACAAPDSVCGWKNGTYNCVAPEEEGCGYFNGERVCFTPQGDKVEEDSPDHPDNGGNLDGNDSNDPMDPRDPTTEGGDPTDQVDSPDTTDANRASEETAKKQLSELFKLNGELKNNTQAIKQGFDSLTEEGNPAAIEATSDSIANTPIDGMQELEDGLATNPLDETAANGVGSSVTGLVTQGTCSELGFNFNGHLFSLSCEKTQKIRDLLSWVLYFLTVWILFDIVTSPVVRRA